MNIFKPFMEMLARSAAAQEKLNNMFKEGNVVRHVKSGTIYTVTASEVCMALLQAHSGKQRIVDWMTPAGTIRDEIADNWDLVAARELEAA